MTKPEVPDEPLRTILPQPRLFGEGQGRRGQHPCPVHPTGTSFDYSKKEGCYLCKTCGKTFSETKGTPFCYLKKRADLIVLRVTLWAHGCPIQAIVAAFGLDERTAATWLRHSGEHCQKVHDKLVANSRLN